MEIIKTLKQIPVLRILLPLMFGIIIGNSYSVNVLLCSILVLCSFFIVLIFYFIPYFKERYSFQRVYGIFLSVFILFCGIILINVQNSKLTFDKIPESLSENYLLKVKDLPREKGKTFQVKAELEVSLNSQIDDRQNLGVILYIAKEDSCVRGLMPGDRIVANTRFNLIKNKNNPDEFDYKTFINRRGYTYTAYLKANTYKIVHSWEGKGLEHQIARLRLSILNKLRDEYDEETYALLSSMLIGVKDDLDDETRNSFSASGITHLLAISGLHVGILYIILTYMFSFFGNSYTSRFVSNTVILCILWLYATLAGLSPSVVRATIMFSVIIFGKLLSRKTMVYNSLAFAALLMLVLNPNNLFEVGFQLSFLAVLGIVYFQPRIHSLINIKNPVISFVWTLVSVSIAAQLATFPLTIFYFHQFPNYFIIGNLLAIPLFFLDLVLGLIYVSLGWIPILGNVLQVVTEFLSFLILKASYFVSELRFSVTNGLYLTKAQVLFIYLTLVFIAYFLSLKRGKYFVSALLSLLAVVSINIYRGIENRNTHELVIYNNPTSLISYNDGINSYNLIDSSAIEDSSYEYSMKEHLIKQNAYSNRQIFVLNENHKEGELIIRQLPNDNKLVVFGKHKLILLQENCFQNKEKITIDYVILENDVQVNLDELSQKIDFEKIVFMASNKSWDISSWISECETLGLDYFSIPDSGAFQVYGSALKE